MERDLLIMIYGAIMGVVGSVLISIFTALFHFWLERREFERRQLQARQRQFTQIHLPTDEEVLKFQIEQEKEKHPEPARTLASAGSALVSVLISSLMVYQTHDPKLVFLFGASLGFLLANREIKSLRRS